MTNAASVLSPVSQIRAVRQLIENPAHWTQRRFATNQNGERTNPSGPSAVCWCVVGAFDKANAFGQSFRFVEQAMYGDVIAYNDAHSHTEIIAALDRAIALADHSASESSS